MSTMQRRTSGTATAPTPPTPAAAPPPPPIQPLDSHPLPTPGMSSLLPLFANAPPDVVVLRMPPMYAVLGVLAACGEPVDARALVEKVRARFPALVESLPGIDDPNLLLPWLRHAGVQVERVGSA